MVPKQLIKYSSTAYIFNHKSIYGRNLKICIAISLFVHIKTIQSRLEYLDQNLLLSSSYAFCMCSVILSTDAKSGDNDPFFFFPCQVGGARCFEINLLSHIRCFICRKRQKRHRFSYKFYKVTSSQGSSAESKWPLKQFLCMNVKASSVSMTGLIPIDKEGAV